MIDPNDIPPPPGSKSGKYVYIEDNAAPVWVEDPWWKRVPWFRVLLIIAAFLGLLVTWSVQK
jgi:hypothetical protein